jgi:ArsR family transcriptional regulator
MLSEENLEELAECLKVLTHPVRIRILEELKGRSVCVSELCRKIGASQSNISQHLTLLRYQGWIKKRRETVYNYYSLSNKNISSALEVICEIISQFE